MAGGAKVSLGAAAELGALSVVTSTGNALQRSALANAASPAPFRPPQWKQALYSITVPAMASTADVSGTRGGTLVMSTVVQAPTLYVFDGPMRVSHSQSVRKSQFPVQSGTNITDNIVREPTRLRMEIVMSDSMAAYADGMWGTGTSKSVACFQAMERIKNARVFVTVATRLETYANMIVMNVQAEESHETRYGLRMVLDLEETFVVSVATQMLSARPDATDSTKLGTKQPLPVPASTTANNKLPNSVYQFVNSPDLSSAYGNVAGAGAYSSNNTSELATAVR